MLIFSIFVLSKNTYATYYWPQSINITASKNQIKVGETLTLNIGITIDPSYNKNKDTIMRTTKYTFSKHNIVSYVSKDDYKMVIKGKSVGSVSVTLRASNGVTGSFLVYVVDSNTNNKNNTSNTNNNSGSTSLGKIYPNKISIDGSSSKTIYVDKGMDLTATVSPSNAFDKTVTWSSSNNCVSVNDKTGHIAGRKTGTATITATTCNGLKATCTVTVVKETTNNNNSNTNNNNSSGIKINPTSYTLKVGEKTTVKVTSPVKFYYDYTKNGVISLERIDSGVYEVKGLKVGTANVTASKDILGLVGKVTCKITVVAASNTNNNNSGSTSLGKIYPNKISIDGSSSKTIYVDKGMDLTATVSPSNAFDKTVTWSSSNNCVSVNDKTGHIAGRKTGTATITATTCNGLKATCTVTVVKETTTNNTNNNSSEIKINPTSYTLKVGEETTVKVTSPVKFYYDYTKNGVISFERIDSGVYKVKGLKVGTADVTASKDQYGLVGKVTCKITVVAANNTNNNNNGSTSLGKIYPNKISIDGSSSKTIYVDKGMDLTATVSPSNAFDKTVTWSSSNNCVSVNDKTGHIAGRKTGTATITATTCNGLKATCTVTVVKETTNNNNSNTNNNTNNNSGNASLVKINPNKVTIDGSSTKTIYVDEGMNLTATVLPDNAFDKTITWASNNDCVSVNSKTGHISGRKAGTATITATTCNGLKATCIVKVVKKETKTVLPTEVKLDKTYVEIYKGGYVNLTATVSPSNATNKNVTWSSSDISIATVVNGKVTGKKVGKAVITVKTDANTKTAKCTVNVVEKPTKISIEADARKMNVGDTFSFKVMVTKGGSKINADGSNYNYTVYSSDDSILYIDYSVTKGYTATAKKAGEASIIAEMEGLNNATHKVKISTVNATGITIKNAPNSLDIGEYYTVSAEVTPSNTTDKTVKWESSDQYVAQINKLGLIHPLKEGTVTITATTVNGKTAKCTIKINPVNVTGLSLDTASILIYPGEQKKLTPSIKPTNATNKKLNWKSENPKIATVDTLGYVKRS